MELGPTVVRIRLPHQQIKLQTDVGPYEKYVMLLTEGNEAGSGQQVFLRGQLLRNQKSNSFCIKIMELFATED